MQFGDLPGGHQNPSHSLIGRDGSPFLGLLPPDDTVNSESVVGIKSGKSSIVAGYQADDLTHTWSSESLVLHQKFTPGSQARCALVHPA